MRWADEIRRYHRPANAYNGRWGSSVTQFVVGAAQDTDLEYLKATDYLYNKLNLRRTYYSAFKPIANTPLDYLPAENPVREHRLYQASFMLRDYGWQMEDLPFEQNGRLPLDVDPKLAWARVNLQERPVEVNRASKEQLLRVPGIGPGSAEKNYQSSPCRQAKITTQSAPTRYRHQTHGRLYSVGWRTTQPSTTIGYLIALGLKRSSK